MSSHNQSSKMQCSTTNQAGGKLFHFATAAPDGGEKGYASGCIWFVSNGASSTFYVNVGDYLSADWNAPTLN